MGKQEKKFETIADYPGGITYAKIIEHNKEFLMAVGRSCKKRKRKDR